MDDPRIVILGAGAVGSLFGGLLAKSGLDVALVGRPVHMKAIRNRGLRIEGLTRATVRPRAATRAPEGDLVLLTVKSYDTARALRSVRLSRNGAVLTLQNGVGNAEKVAARFGARRTLAGVTSCGALLAGPGRVVHTGRGPTVVGEWSKGATVGAREVAALFNSARIPTRVSRDIRAELWRKVAVNAAINPLTALTGLPNRAVAETRGLRDLAAAVVEEAERVARARRISLGRDPLGRVLEVARRTGANRSSMLRDLERGRRTEIEAITGALLREAERAGVEAPVNRLLYELVRSLERKADKRRS
ncbi:MAG: 2-dehydropantoate 2-reductase [Halobacteria archaeon]